MLKHDRIQQYAEKLRQEEDFKSRLLRQLARDIHLQLSQRQEKGLNQPYDESKAVSYSHSLIVSRLILNIWLASLIFKPSSLIAWITF